MTSEEWTQPLRPADPVEHPWLGSGPEWVGEWIDSGLPLFGLSPQLDNVLLWFGDPGGRAIMIEYPWQVLTAWKQTGGSLQCRGWLAVPFRGVSPVSVTSGVYVNRIPAGWIRIRGAEVRSADDG